MQKQKQKQPRAKPRQLSRPPAPQRKEIPELGLPRGLLGVADAPDIGQPDDAHPSWRLSLLDLDHAGSWSWEIDEADLRKIVDFLTRMERHTWKEIKSQVTGSKSGSHRKHHAMPSEDLCQEAQRRLREKQLEGFDLFRFRLGNMERLWGFIYGGVFYPVWWDPDHQVYPPDSG